MTAISITDDPTPNVSLVLAGGLARGAFEAGALDAITRCPVKIRRIVAASSGALNAVVLGAAVRGGNPHAGAERLAELWDERASWMKVFRPSVGELVFDGALSSMDAVLELLRAQTPSLVGAGRVPVSLRILVAPLEGNLGAIGGAPATTYEMVVPFEGEVYDDAEKREWLYNAALASAALPFVFPPRELWVGGKKLHAIDGGVVNNTPVKVALRDLDADSGIDTVIVLAPYPQVVEGVVPTRGIDLAAQVIEMLIDERFYRDLREAEEVNQRVSDIEALRAQGFTDEQVKKVRALAVGERRQVRVIVVRPEARLEGTAVSAFFDGGLRKSYLEQGAAAAEKVMRACNYL